MSSRCSNPLVPFGLKLLCLSLGLAGCAQQPQRTVDYPPSTPTPSAVAPVASPAPAPQAAPATPAPAPAPTVSAPPPPPEPSAAETALNHGVAAYERGDFAAAIRLLGPLGSDTSLTVAQRLRALKTLAFAQCVSGATTACRSSFEQAFRLDANFDLARAEHGHPVWGPQFQRARRTVLGR